MTVTRFEQYTRTHKTVLYAFFLLAAIVPHMLLCVLFRTGQAGETKKAPERFNELLSAQESAGLLIKTQNSIVDPTVYLHGPDTLSFGVFRTNTKIDSDSSHEPQFKYLHPAKPENTQAIDLEIKKRTPASFTAVLSESLTVDHDAAPIAETISKEHYPVWVFPSFVTRPFNPGSFSPEARAALNNGVKKDISVFLAEPPPNGGLAPFRLTLKRSCGVPILDSEAAAKISIFLSGLKTESINNPFTVSAIWSAPASDMPEEVFE